MGKTSILEAIYYLCMGKSHAAVMDTQLTKDGEVFFRLDSHWTDGDLRNQVVFKVPLKKKKVLEINGTALSRLADHIGNYPVVIITPEETQLATEGSEVRRKYIDSTLSQVDSLYLRNLIAYNKVLDQRNALLKQSSNRQDLNTLLDIYDQQLVQFGSAILRERVQFLQILADLFQPIYQGISGKAETAGFTYQTKLFEQDYRSLLLASRPKDLLLQRTNVGIHKDDLLFEINGRPVKKFASQGQLKSFVLAMKIAQFDYLFSQKGTTPILLLDDIFDRLDQERVQYLMQAMYGYANAQIFITDTDATRIEKLLAPLGIAYKHFVVEQGKVGY